MSDASNSDGRGVDTGRAIDHRNDLDKAWYPQLEQLQRDLANFGPDIIDAAPDGSGIRLIVHKVMELSDRVALLEANARGGFRKFGTFQADVIRPFEEKK